MMKILFSCYFSLVSFLLLLAPCSLVIGRCECEDQVLKRAKRLLLEIRLEDQEDGVLAGKGIVLGLVGETCRYFPYSLVHIGREFRLANLLTAL